MIVTKKILVDKLLQYINRQIDLAALVSWSEEMMQDADLDEKDVDLIRDILSRIGLADVREFGLTWTTAMNIFTDSGMMSK